MFSFLGRNTVPAPLMPMRGPLIAVVDFCGEYENFNRPDEDEVAMVHREIRQQLGDTVDAVVVCRPGLRCKILTP